jgi:RHS repeat-associated protein
MESWQDKLNKTTSFTWTRSTPGKEWKENIKYDPNGNILTYKRNDEKGEQIDDLTYKYTRDVDGNLTTNNRLNAVKDAAADSPRYADDIEGTDTDNAFTYDKIGNLSFDTKLNTHFSWTVYGKMNSAVKYTYTGALSQQTGSEFGYDAQQNRYKKDNFSREEDESAHTLTEKHDINYYIRDAQGNVLAIYNKQHNFTTNTETSIYSQQAYQFNQKEQHLYGSSRLGIVQLDRPMSAMSFNASDLVSQSQGVRNYELTNHLGNVLSTITDKGVITSAQDYYPFGLTLASRSFTEGGSSYRYSFNGKEDDKDLKQQDYGMRISRPDLGRFLSVDPISKQYPELTPYQFASNRPIQGVDLDGLEFSDSKGNPLGPLSQDGIRSYTESGSTVLGLNNHIYLPVVTIKSEKSAKTDLWITAQQLHDINPARNVKNLVVWANELNQVDISKTGINSPLRQAHFLAQICHETDGFRVVEEDMQHYTAQRITEIWPKRFPDLESAKPYAQNAEKLANKVYSNRMGNGDEASGDGYNFRGRGAIQLTGRESYSKFTKWYQKEFGDITVDFEKNPSLIGLPKYSILSAVWEYTIEKKGLNQAADKDDILSITKKINGGTTGLEDRKDRLSRAKKALDTQKP